MATTSPLATSATGVPGRRTGVLLALVGLALLTVVLVRGDALPHVDPAGPRSWPLGATVLLTGAPTALLVGAWIALARPGGRLAELSDAQLRRGREVTDAVSESTLMLALTAVGLPAVLVAGEGFGYGGAVLLTSVLAAWAGRQAGQGLRTWLGSAGLRRSVPLPAWQVVLALILLPALAASAVAVPAVLLVEGPWWVGVHLALAGLAATMRSADPVPTEVGALLTTPAGALPTGPLHQALHGPDVALVLALVLVLVGEPWVLAAALLALAWQVTRDR